MGGALSSTNSSWVANLAMAGAGLLSLALGALYYYQDNLLYHPYIPGVPKTPRENPQGFRYVRACLLFFLPCLPAAAVILILPHPVLQPHHHIKSKSQPHS